MLVLGFIWLDTALWLDTIDEVVEFKVGWVAFDNLEDNPCDMKESKNVSSSSPESFQAWNKVFYLKVLFSKNLHI